VAYAAETRLCAWLSVSTFAGLVAFAVLGWTWIDAVAGFVIRALRSPRAGRRGRANSSATTDATRARHGVG
jgi:divalent metal cation (Fe/Co/Zn/Cd) transporter